MLVFQTNPVGVELFSYVNVFFHFQLIAIETGHPISNFLTSCQRLTPLWV